jgi:hypothetical protein
MTSDQLQQANKINGQIALIDEMDKEVERFKKTRFSGALPLSVSRFIAINPDIALKIVEMVLSEGVAKREGLQKQLTALW